MYKLLVFTIITFAFNLSVLAQGSVGSPYTRYGIGDMNSGPLIRNSSMGGLSYTLPYKNNINYINPAGIANIDSLTFILDVGISGGTRNYSIATPPVSHSRYDVQLSYFNLGFSLFKWWKMAFGAAPYSNVGYNIVYTDNSLNVEREHRNEGSGGISRIFWSNAFIPVKNLRVGINATYNIGTIYNYNKIDFGNDEQVGFFDFIEETNTRISDFSFDLGLQYDFFLNKKNKFTIGLLYSHNSDLRSFQSGVAYNENSKSSANYIIRDTLSVSDEAKGIVSLPLAIGIGLGYCFNDKLFMGVDYTLQSWKNAQFFGDIDSMNNGNYISFGTEYTPAGYSGNAYNFWQAVSYRFGAYYNQTYFKLEDVQTPINDFGITFGLGLPLKRSRTSFDVSLKLGQRGTHDKDLVRERYFIVGVGFNLNDVWFIKRKFD